MVKLFRYIDKVTGEERGISYSDKDGNSPINNPTWDCIEISESDKENFIGLHRQQLKAKEPKPKSEKECILNALDITEEHLEKIRAMK